MTSQINATATDNPFILNIQYIYGYSLIGSFLSSAAWGVSCLQLFIFYMNSEHDSALLKTMLFFLWVLDTANEILIIKSNWLVLILQYGRIANLRQITPEILHHIWVEFFMALVVQLYFIHRIYKFSTTMVRGMKLKLVLGIIALLTLLAVGQIVSMILYVVYLYGQPLAVLGIKRQIDINITARVLSMVVDIGIAVVMVYLIRRKSHFKRTKRMISRLMIVIVSSGSFTAVLSVITLILTVVYQHSEQFLMFDAPTCSIYFSTLLANLNSRNFVRGTENANVVSSKDTIVGVPLDDSGPQSSKSVGDILPIEIQDPISLAS